MEDNKIKEISKNKIDDILEILRFDDILNLKNK